jgi:AsmA protein
MKRKVLWTAGVTMAVLVVLVILLPLLFDANRFRPEVESRLTLTLGRQVKIGSLKLDIFAGGVQAKEISIADDPTFSREPFIKAGSLNVGVQMKPLLLDHQVKIESLVLNDPVVRLLQSSSGKWNYSTLGQKQAKTSSQGSSGIQIDKLQILNGRVEVGRANGKQQAFTDVGVKVSGISETSAFPFEVSATAPSGGKLGVDGKAGPVNQADMSRTPFAGDVKISNLDLASLGMMGDSGLGGSIDYKGKVISDGRKVTSDGIATANKLRVVKGGGSAQQPIEVQYHSSRCNITPTTTWLVRRARSIARRSKPARVRQIFQEILLRTEAPAIST